MNETRNIIQIEINCVKSELYLKRKTHSIYSDFEVKIHVFDCVISIDHLTHLYGPALIIEETLEEAAYTNKSFNPEVSRQHPQAAQKFLQILNCKTATQDLLQF
jgi:hypothetical protein